MTHQPNSTFPKAFVCGWPIEQSRSPVIHSYWLNKYDMKGSYEKIAIEPSAFPDFLNSLKQKNFVGGNITLPHKETALKNVDRLDDAAMKIGAVNTLWFEGNELVGGNTDWIGFAANLDQIEPGWDSQEYLDKPVLVLGAGGAARGILYALMQRGFQKIFLANRTFEKAAILAKEFGPGINAISMDELGGVPGEIGLLVNTTSLGMAGKQSLPKTVIALIGRLDESTIINDIVYIPLQTELLKLASQNGMKTVDGLGMLLHQAVPGFEKWFGVKPQVTEELRISIVADIEANR